MNGWNWLELAAVGVLAFSLVLCGGASAQGDNEAPSDKVYLVGDDFSAWRGDTGEWEAVGEVFTSPDDEKVLASKPGKGALLNGPTGRTKHLVSKQEFGDVVAHIEFMVPKGSNSGVYFQGRFEIQVLDSWGVAKPTYTDCGGIYQRWDDSRDPQGFEGHPPRVNAALAPGQWQTFDVVFRAPRFDDNGKKTAHARFDKVIHNSQVVHENVLLNGPTRACLFGDEKPLGPMMFQGDHGPVAYRNIWIAPAPPEEPGLRNPFFAMDTSTKDANHQTPAAQAGMLNELGYAGFGYTGFDNLQATCQALDDHGLLMFTTYVGAMVEPDGYTYDEKLKAGVKELKGRKVMIWLTVTSSTYKPSSPDGDEQAVKLVREIAEIAAENDLGVALYPHTGCWLERVEDAVRVAQKVDRKNVGATFNLCHWLKVDGKDLRARLEQALPHLSVVTINGADTDGTDWGRLIQTLDKGSYDVGGLLTTLEELEYTGPIGLQGYGIGGDVHDNLKRSMDAWQELSR